MPPFRRNREAGQTAVAMLAVIVVLVLGVVGCSAMIVSTHREPTTPLLICGSGFGLAAFFLFRMSLVSDRQVSRQKLFWFGFRDEGPGKTQYQVKRIKPQMASSTENQPPSVESVRDIAQQHARWNRSGTISPDRSPRNSSETW